MLQAQDGERADRRAHQASDVLLRHYRRIGAPAIVAALHVSEKAAFLDKVEGDAGETRRVLPPFLYDDHAA